jgi:protein tyrosine/serine phosphatase
LTSFSPITLIREKTKDKVYCMAKIICFLFSIILIISGIPVKSEVIYKNQITIKNFAKVDNFYYRAGQPKDSEFQQIASLGVKTVINLRYPFNFNKEGMLKQKAIANSLGMNFINIPMLPTKPPSDEQINCYFNILRNPANLPVLVYDMQGKDRMGLMAALYRVKFYHWTYNQAYSEMRAYGYHRVIYPRLKHFLRDYAKLQGNDKNLTNPCK